MGFISLISRKVFAEPKQFMIDAIHAKTDPINESDGLEGAREKFVAMHRGMPQDIVRVHASNESSRAVDLQTIPMAI
jgi:hypothetical protein